MKKVVSLILALVLVFSATLAITSCNKQTNDEVPHEDTPPPSDGQGMPPKEKSYYEFSLLSDGTYGVNKFLDSTVTEISIPESYNGKKVTKILSNAFKNASNLKSVTVPNSVQEIAEGAFSGCSSLESLSIPFVGTKKGEAEPLGYIFGLNQYSGGQETTQRFKSADGYERDDYFYIPSGLKKVTVTDGVVNEYAFRNCIMIKEIVLGDDVTDIEPYSLSGCSGLETVRMGKGITEIGDDCFRFLSGLKTVVIGENVQTIGNYAFYYCTAIESITIPYNVVTIEKYAFYYCTAMTSIKFECTSGWYRDYGSSSNTGMDVTDTGVNAENLTDGRKYACDRWKRR